jgi:dTDP-4-dehydrorhamnose reductase
MQTSPDYLVTGAGGQLGQQWVQWLRDQGKSFVAYTSAELDITNITSINTIIDQVKPDFLINCAAYTKVDQAEEDQDLAEMVNVDGAANLADACRRHKVKLIHYSTDYVFSGAESDTEAFPEGYPPLHSGSPGSVYGHTKWRGEQEIRNLMQDYLIIRVSWLCGRFGNNFVKTMLRLGRERDEIRVVDDQIGSPSFALPVVALTAQLLDKKATGVYHIASEGTISWFDFATEIMSQAGLSCKVLPIKTFEYPVKASRPHYSKLDCSDTVSLIGKPMGDWKEHLRHLIDDLKLAQ